MLLLWKTESAYGAKMWILADLFILKIPELCFWSLFPVEFHLNWKVLQWLRQLSWTQKEMQSASWKGQYHQRKKNDNQPSKHNIFFVFEIHDNSNRYEREQMNYSCKELLKQLRRIKIKECISKKKQTRWHEDENNGEVHIKKFLEPIEASLVGNGNNKRQNKGKPSIQCREEIPFCCNFPKPVLFQLLKNRYLAT